MKTYLLLALIPLLVLGGTDVHAEGPPIWARCHDAVDWFHAADVPSAEQDLLDLATTGRLAIWSETWIKQALADAPSMEACLEKARTENKPLFWYVPSVVGQHMILPNLLDRYVITGPLSHPDVTGILNARFVNLKVPGGGKLAKRFGLEAPGFVEPGFLVLAPDGTVLHRVNRFNTMSAHYVADMLRRVLALEGADGLAEDDGPTPTQLFQTFRKGTASGAKELVATCRSWIERGFDEEALEALEAVHAFRTAVGLRTANALIPTPLWSEVTYLLAIVHRRARRAEDALALLDEAARDAPDALVGDIAVERARVYVGAGMNVRARRALEDVLARHPNCLRGAEGRYLLGVAETMDGADDAALVSWQTLVKRRPDSIWAARADASAVMGGDGRRGESALARAFLDPRWMHPDVYGLAEDTQWRRTASDVDDIRERALGFLLRQQRENGSFVGPRWGQNANKAPDRNIEVAITALCCEALHRHADHDARVKDALAKAEAWLLGDPGVRRGDAVVWVYADGLRLRHFARRLPGLARKQSKAVREHMSGWISNLEAHQAETKGPFKHYTYTSTFVTAAIACCLHDAKAAGLDVEVETFALANAAILSARSDETGLFGYLLTVPASTRTPKGAAQRQPLCEWALFRGGQADLDRLDRAMAIYLDTFEDSAGVSRKTNFHIPSLDHTAGYYFFHDFLFACECARACAPPRRVKHLEQLLDHLCALPEIDGSFVDSGFSYGKAYGTAMALISLSIIERGLTR